MAYIEDPATGDQLKVTPVSKAARTAIYDPDAATGAKVTNADPASSDNGLVVRMVTGSSGQQVSAKAVDGYAPDPAAQLYRDLAAVIGGPVPLAVDSFGQLLTRGPVCTDEGSLREDYPGSTLALTSLTGTVTFESGSNIVTGAGTLFTSEVSAKHFIKLSSHAESTWTQVARVIDDTHLQLVEGYKGASGGGTANKSRWVTVTGSGGSFAVGTSNLTIASGATNPSKSYCYRPADFMPLALTFRGVTVSQRVANQKIILGLVDNVVTPANYAYFLFDSTNDYAVKCVTCHEGGVEESNTVTVKYSTSTASTFRIEVQAEDVSFFVQDVCICVNRLHLPDMYSTLSIYQGVENTGAATTTNLVVDTVLLMNVDRLEVRNSYAGDALPVRSVRIESKQGQTHAIAVKGLSNVFGSGTSKQYLTIHHASTAKRNVYIKLVRVTIVSVSAAVTVSASLRKFSSSTAPSGGSTQTPVQADQSDETSECTTMTLPSTAGASEYGIFAEVSWALGISTPSVDCTKVQPVVLYEYQEGRNMKCPKIRAGSQEGWCVSIQTSAAATVVACVEIHFTEETNTALLT